MIRLLTTAALAVLMVSASTTVRAEQVTVKGAHLCCGACQARANKALEGLKGVTKASVDRNARVITFLASDKNAAALGINSLAKAGFYGAATHGKEPAKFPASGARKGIRRAKVTVEGLHLCCDACVVGAQKAVRSVRGVKAIEIDRKLRTIRLLGSRISQLDAIAALNKAGFYARIPVKKKKKQSQKK